MNNLDCSICKNTFDGDHHRPRALPCGHGYCTQCIETSINEGIKTCPSCRTEHGASSATDLPVSFLLEELLHKATISESQKQEHEADLFHDEVNVDMCPKHKEIPLHFRCRSHNVKICYKCAVKDHPLTSCNLITLDDEIIEIKKAKILAVQKENQVLINLEKDLKMLLQKNIDNLRERSNIKQEIEREVELLLNKIQQMNYDISIKEKSQEEIKDAVQSCQGRQNFFKLTESKLSDAVFNQEIVKQCDMATSEILQTKKWTETIGKELGMDEPKQDMYAQFESQGIICSSKVLTEGNKMFINNLNTLVKPPISAQLIQCYQAPRHSFGPHLNPTQAWHLPAAAPGSSHQPSLLTSQHQPANQQNKQEMYAQFESLGIIRSSKVLTEGKNMFIPNLNKFVKPPISAQLIQVGKLNLTSSSTTVYMDLSVHGGNLGRLYFNILTDRPHGQQFVMMILGSGGPTLKWSKFWRRKYNCITMLEYLTENGSQSSKPLLPNLKSDEDYRGSDSKGRIFPRVGGVDKASFTIMTKSGTNNRCGYFGEVVGMKILDVVASDKYDITDITICECGIVMKTNE